MAVIEAPSQIVFQLEGEYKRDKVKIIYVTERTRSFIKVAGYLREGEGKAISVGRVQVMETDRDLHVVSINNFSEDRLPQKIHKIGTHLITIVAYLAWGAKKGVTLESIDVHAFYIKFGFLPEIFSGEHRISDGVEAYALGSKEPHAIEKFENLRSRSSFLGIRPTSSEEAIISTWNRKKEELKELKDFYLKNKERRPSHPLSISMYLPAEKIAEKAAAILPITVQS